MITTRTLHRWTRRDYLLLGILSSIVVAIFYPILKAQVGGEDFGGHEILVRQMEAAGTITLPHFLYHGLMIAMDRLFPSFGLTLDSLILLLMFEVMLGAILLWIFLREFGETSSAKESIVRILLIVALMTVAPILPLALVTGKLHPGDWNFLAITNYFNPTMILVRPLALLLFYCSILAFQEIRPSGRIVLFTACMAILTTLAKPNYAICLLPALLIMAVIRMLRKEPLQRGQLLWGLLLPLVAVLSWQYWFTYSHKSLSLTESHIILAPFAMFPWNWIGVRYLLSILFPLVALLLFWKQSSRNIPFVFAWIVFGLGSFFTYFIAESGDRMKDGNFVWSGQITLFVLFVVAVVGLRRWSREAKTPWKSRIAWSTFALHSMSGIVWYVGHFTRLH